MPMAGITNLALDARLVTFDFYTALVDYQATIVPALRCTLGEAVDAAGLARAWRAKQLEWAQLSNSLSRARIPFRECTRLALVHVLARQHIELADSDVDGLVGAWNRLAPWPEAPATIAAIKARGYAIAILSNGDEAMLRSGAKAFDVAFLRQGDDRPVRDDELQSRDGGREIAVRHAGSVRRRGARTRHRDMRQRGKVVQSKTLLMKPTRKASITDTRLHRHAAVFTIQFQDFVEMLK